MAQDDSIDRGRRVLLVAVSAMILSTVLRPAGAQEPSTTSSRTPIGVIGSGHIGGTVGGLNDGHPVMFSSRHPDQLKGIVESLGPLAHAGMVEEAITFGNAIFLAVPYGGLPQIGRDYGKMLAGKVVLDAGNASASRDRAAIAEEVERDGIGVVTQRYLPGAHIVRAFNTLNFSVLAKEANRPPPRLAIPIAGDDLDAMRVAAGLVRDAGFDPVEVGGLADARRFQRGGPGYGQAVSAVELKKTLSLSP
jgi:predicted dinucleotide-binding enzyme